MSAVYNENDPKAAAWLRHLIEEGVIAHGIVDERSICDVEARDYRGFAQVHLFAGIGIWSSALRLAGWPDDRRVGTCSCPCQPFSAAGKGLGFSDPRHLWPHAFRIIRELRLDVVFGEQAPTAVDWIDLVSFDLEGVGYAIGAPVVPAAGFGGAHIRSRFYWVADANNAQWWSDRAPRDECDWPAAGRVEGDGDVGQRSGDVRLGHANGERRNWIESVGQKAGRRESTDVGSVGWLENPQGIGCEGRPYTQQQFYPGICGLLLAGPSAPFGADWLLCRDGRHRPVEPGVAPLAAADSARVGLLRGYGNALDRETAANFVVAYMEAAPPRAAA